MATTSKGLPDSTITRMQEIGSAWVFKRAIQDNATWDSAEDIKSDSDTFNFLPSFSLSLDNPNPISNS